MRIDLSADVGEGADDFPIFPLVTSVSVACGAHAGDEDTMDRCVAEAKRLGVAVGAHPGYPDREGFGRRPLDISDEDLTATLLDQIAALRRVCDRSAVPLSHVKPHGALYNGAALDASVAAIVARAVGKAGPGLILVGLAGSEMIRAAANAGIPAAGEAFADRRYMPDASLAPRGLTDALITEPSAAAAQAVAIARGEPVEALGGRSLRIEAATICLHADTPGAADIARAVRDALDRAGVEVAPLAKR